MSDEKQDPLETRGFSWSLAPPPSKPDAVDYLAAIEDGDGEAAKRIARFEGHEAQIKEDFDLMAKMANSEDKQAFVIDVKNGFDVAVVIEEAEDADTEGD